MGGTYSEHSLYVMRNNLSTIFTEFIFCVDLHVVCFVLC